jgi:hypothetical protein
VGAAGTATERALAVTRHLDGPPDGGDELTRLVAHVVVTREVAGVVIRDLAVAAHRLELPVAHELGEQLRVMYHLVAAAEVRVFLAERVQTMRAARDDLRHACVVQRGDVLLGIGLEDVLVAHPPCRVAGARLACAEDREVDAGLLHQLHGRLGRDPRALVVGGGATDPVEDVGRLLAFVEHANAEIGRPRCPVALRLSPRIADALDVAQHRLRLLREARLHHHEITAQVDDVVDVLDRDRALVHARAARDAVPDHLLRHPVAGDRRQLAACQ